MVRTLRLVAFSVVTLSLLGAKDSQAQAWLKDPGKYYFKLEASYFWTNEVYDADGDIQPIFWEDPGISEGWFKDITINSYLEYGLSRNFTLVMDLPFKIYETSDTRELIPGGPEVKTVRTNAGLGDLRTSVRVPVFRTNPVVSSLQAGVKLPMFYEKPPTDNGGPALGTGYVDFEIQALLGVSLWPFPGYGSGGFGYRVRGGEQNNDEYFFNVEGGITISRLFMKLRLEGVKNTTEIDDVLSGDQVNGDQDWLKAMPTLSFRISKNVSILAEAFHVVGGANTTAGTTWAAGLEFTN